MCVCLRGFNVHPSNKFWSSQLIKYSIRELLFGLAHKERRGELRERKREREMEEGDGNALRSEH